MKRIILFISLLVSTLCIFALETKKVAILEVVDKEDKLSYHQKLMLRSRLAEEINRSAGFEAYDRINTEAIMEEHLFQRTGYVSSDQIRQLGAMAGASYILVIEGAVSTQGNLFVSATLLDVETGKMAVTETQNMATSDEGLKQGCTSMARKLFGELQAATNAAIKDEKRTLQEQEAAREAERAKYYVYKKKKGYTYMGTEMDKKAYTNFLKTNCPDAYKQYVKGQKLTIAGWTLFGVGIATVAGGGIYYCLLENHVDKCHKDPCWGTMTAEQENDFDKNHNKYRYISYSIMGAGGAMLVTSIPLLSVGYAKQCKKSVSIYNEQCSSPSIPPLTFNLTAGPNGLGVAMNF